MKYGSILDERLWAAEAFAALGSEARLEILRQLVRAGPSGLAVGAVQERLGIAGSTLSHHLRALVACGLVSQMRDGRCLICRAELARIQALGGFLVRECCAESGEQEE